MAFKVVKRKIDVIKDRCSTNITQNGVPVTKLTQLRPLSVIKCLKRGLDGLRGKEAEPAHH